MINQQLVRALLLGALLIPSINVAMKRNVAMEPEKNETAEWDIESELKGGPYSRHDDNQETPSFPQVCVEESLRIAPYAIPIAVAGFYTAPSLISPVTTYVKENAAYVAKTTGLMALNVFVLYNWKQESKERLMGNPHPDKRSSVSWLCLAPLINAAAITTVSDSTLAVVTAWGVLARSILSAFSHNLTDSNDRIDIENYKTRKRWVENSINILKCQTKSFELCSEPTYTQTLLSRQGQLVREASAFKEHYDQLSDKKWLTREQTAEYKKIREKYHHVINNEYCPLTNKVVSSNLSSNIDEKHELSSSLNEDGK